MTTIAVLVAYALVATSTYFGIARYLERRVDEALDTKAHVMATLVHRDGERLEFEFDDSLMPEFSRTRSPEYFELRLADGSVFERSLSMGLGRRLDSEQPPKTDRVAFDIRLPDTRHGRAVAIPVNPQSEIDGELIGESYEEPE